MRRLLFLLCFCCISLHATSKVELGVDLFFKEGHADQLKGKRVGLITNQTGVNSTFKSTVELFKESQAFSLVALFAPEHGLNGSIYAGENVKSGKDKNIPVYSLHGDTRRPTDAMLKGIDVLVYDIQEVGCRSYTFATTLFYVMEEAAKRGIDVIVLDRPNPINGVIVDGPMLHENYRSFVGYLNIPYCHGMTIGELAHFFNDEYKIGCNLKIVLMHGWKRTMSYKDTGLTWIPTSPYIPEQDTPLFYASTGILGTLNLVNIGIGYTLPFKVVGAPWIKAKEFAAQLNTQKLPGVQFVPFSFRPFYGLYKEKECQGVKIIVTNSLQYRPLAVQYLIMGMLKTLYPKQVSSKLSSLGAAAKKSFCQANGNEEMWDLFVQEKYVAWKLINYEQSERNSFLETRKRHLLY